MGGGSLFIGKPGALMQKSMVWTVRTARRKYARAAHDTSSAISVKSVALHHLISLQATRYLVLASGNTSLASRRAKQRCLPKTQPVDLHSRT